MAGRIGSSEGPAEIDRLGVTMAVALVVGFAVAWIFWGPFSFSSAKAKVTEEAALLNGRDPQPMLAEAKLCYRGHNLPLALPLYQRAEELFTQAHDARDALCAKIGVMRTAPFFACGASA
jgi:hypothetical protein